MTEDDRLFQLFLCIRYYTSDKIKGMKNLKGAEEELLFPLLLAF